MSEDSSKSNSLHLELTFSGSGTAVEDIQYLTAWKPETIFHAIILDICIHLPVRRELSLKCVSDVIVSCPNDLLR